MKTKEAMAIRIGATIPVSLFKKLKSVSQDLGRTMSDLLKEGLWLVIQKEQNKQGG